MARPELGNLGLQIVQRINVELEAGLNKFKVSHGTDIDNVVKKYRDAGTPDSVAAIACLAEVLENQRRANYIKNMIETQLSQLEKDPDEKQAIREALQESWGRKFDVDLTQRPEHPDTINALDTMTHKLRNELMVFDNGKAKRNPEAALLSSFNTNCKATMNENYKDLATAKTIWNAVKDLFNDAMQACGSTFRATLDTTNAFNSFKNQFKAIKTIEEINETPKEEKILSEETERGISLRSP